MSKINEWVASLISYICCSFFGLLFVYFNGDVGGAECTWCVFNIGEVNWRWVWHLKLYIRMVSVYPASVQSKGLFVIKSYSFFWEFICVIAFWDRELVDLGINIGIDPLLSSIDPLISLKVPLLSSIDFLLS